MTPKIFLLLNLALAFYGVGAIWAHEADIFRTWKLLDPATFRAVQTAHWHRLPYWIFAPVGLASLGSLALIWLHPPDSPRWAIMAAPLCLWTSNLLTAILWGPWQARLSKDPLGAASPYLARILSTHWIRTSLINGYAVILLLWAIRTMA
jgi:hypothetical protein